MIPPALSAVLDRPAEDAPRLVCADWLDEYAGDLPDPQAARDRAELVRVQIEVARMQARYRTEGAATAPGAELINGWSGREADLLHRHGAAWVGFRGFAPGGPHGYRVGIGNAVEFSDRSRVTFTRGFPAAVRCDLADWQRHAPALLAAHPLERVEVADVPGLVFEVLSGRRAELLGSAPWALFAGLEIRGGSIPAAFRVATFPDRAMLVSESGRIIADQTAGLRAAAGGWWPGRVVRMRQGEVTGPGGVTLSVRPTDPPR